MSERSVPERSLPTHCVSGAAIVTNDEGKYLLVKNPRKGWEFPGGLVEQGESVAQGTIREVREESGVHIEITGFSGIYSSTDTRPGYNGVKTIPTSVNIVFKGRYLSGELKTSDESIEVGWFTKDEALELLSNRERVLMRFKNALEDRVFVVSPADSYIFD